MWMRRWGCGGGRVFFLKSVRSAGWRALAGLGWDGLVSSSLLLQRSAREAMVRGKV